MAPPEGALTNQTGLTAPNLWVGIRDRVNSSVRQDKEVAKPFVVTGAEFQCDQRYRCQTEKGVYHNFAYSTVTNKRN
jgi:hypothetical protein